MTKLAMSIEAVRRGLAIAIVFALLFSQAVAADPICGELIDRFRRMKLRGT